ncbi:MAG: primary-amine oxidase [Paracoccaceae bacterium]|nr:primary-amine oxidase [Paracoccaceae bacterium]
MDDIAANQQSHACAHSATHRKATHPLDSLTADEILTVTRVVHNHPEFGTDVLFETVELREPTKAEVRAFNPGDRFKRQARAAVFRRGGIGVWRLVVSIAEEEIVSIDHLPDARPMIQLEEFMVIEDMVKSDPDFIAACKKRGVGDLSLVCVDPWSAGNFGIEGEEGRHLCHTFAWLRTREFDNLYAHPIEGLNAVVDIKTGEVIRIDDYGVTPVPMAEHNYESRFQSQVRDHLKPIDVVQPEGVSFKLTGRHITWHDWSMVIGFNVRESLSLHDIRFGDRPVLYRASLAEMVVPYGSPKNGHFRKSVFDVGEYGIGKLVNSLELGCDCLGAIQYLDVDINDMYGKIFRIPKAICIHEEDHGILWKHTDFRTEVTEVRRARRLVISSIATVGNYEYAMYWYFYLDGTIEFEMKATGILNTVAGEPSAPDKYATEVAPGVFGQIHQHVFCARLDLAIDGDENSVVECNTHAEPPGDDNPYGNAFYEEETVLKTEQAAARRIKPEHQRYWKFINSGKTNFMGKPVGYKLDPSHCVMPFMAEDSPSGKRAAFTQNHLWVTAYNPEERYPAGEYMNHSDGTDGLVGFIADDGNVEDTDIVAWHTFGLHHQPRLEDFPVQPCISSGFKLMPSGFFDRNPCLDLPAQANRASCNAGAAMEPG